MLEDVVSDLEDRIEALEGELGFRAAHKELEDFLIELYHTTTDFWLRREILGLVRMRPPKEKR